MRTLAIVFAATSLAASSTVLATSQDDVAAITRLEHELSEVQTIEQIMPFYRPSDSTVVFDGFEPGVFRGTKAIADNFSTQMASEKSIKIDFRMLTVEAEGSLGVAYSIQHATVNMKDGSVMEITFRETDVLKKSRGRWLITHQHISYPSDAKTGKTVFNSAEK